MARGLAPTQTSSLLGSIKPSQDILNFDERKVSALNWRISQYQEKLDDLYANARFHEVEYSRLIRLILELHQSHRRSTVQQLLSWFQESYKPAKQLLILQASQVQRIAHAQIKYRPQLGFWNEDLKQLLDLQTVSFSPLRPALSKYLLGAVGFQSVGVIPFVINDIFLKKDTAKINPCRQFKAWLVFADRGNQFLPDSSLSNGYLLALQNALVEAFSRGISAQR